MADVSLTKGLTVMYEGDGAIGDLGYALKLFAGFYKTIYDALKEFFINAVEAQAGQVVLYFYVAGTKPFLSLKDNGSGMSPQRLKEVAESICLSLKRGEPLTGRHAIGMFSAAKWLEAELLLVTSKPPGQTAAYTLAFPLTGKRLHYRIYEEPQQNLVPQQGTVVKLEGLPEKERKSLTIAMASQGKRGVSRLAEYLGTAFRGQFLANQLIIRLERRGGRSQGDEYVHAVGFSGVPVAIEPVKTSFGEVRFELFCRTSAKGAGAVSLQHFAGPIVTDLVRELAEDFGHEPWTRYEGQIYAPWLERSGGGVATRHKTYLAFRHALQQIAPRLREFYRHVSEESLSTDEAGALRQLFRKVLGGESLLFLGRLKIPKTHLLTSDGTGREMQLIRSELNGHRGPTTEKGTGREPYAGPPPDRWPITTKPVPKPTRTGGVSARTVSGLQWKLGPFPPEKRDKLYELEGGWIFVNTAHERYVLFVDPEQYEGRHPKKETLKLLWMGMVTCIVLVDLNMPTDHFTPQDRELCLVFLNSLLSARLLG